MLNILSIGCGVAFAPYLAESAAEFLNNDVLASRVVRQGGRALILRSDNGAVILRHENRQAFLGREEVRHYSSTIQFRRKVFDVSRMQDEVVLANIGDDLLLSHPQSELWLHREIVRALLEAYACGSIAKAGERPAGLPEWLKVSMGGSRLLLSDHRTGRWVLLGDDHMQEFERRIDSLRPAVVQATGEAAPTLKIKGLTVHLQSGLRLARTLEDFSQNGRVMPFEEITPVYTLKTSASTEGIELSDSSNRVALTSREARKWASILRSYLDGLKVSEVERCGVRTVFACTETGRWIVQWGDEVFLPNGMLPALRVPGTTSGGSETCIIASRVEEFLLLLSPATGACIALTDSESSYLHDGG